MPDISNKGAHEFWHGYPDPTIYKVISFMESVENWTQDGNQELEKVMSELGSTLGNIGNIDLQEEDKFISLASCIKMGRSLRLLQCMDLAYPGAATKILMFAEKAPDTDSASALFLKRNLAFERLRLLKGIFSNSRLATIAKILIKN
jgi:intracellular multiplication protein IcmW